MPIAPHLRHLYRGPEYEAQRERIFKRDRNECKWCSKPNGARIQTKTGQGRMFWRKLPLGPWLNEDGWVMTPEDHDAAMLLGAPRTITVVLAMAHLDHNPENREDSNAAVLCQWCHLRHDRRQHRMTLVANRDARRPLCEVVERIA
jgi:hypothetical protein